jgi:hypothetical protein
LSNTDELADGLGARVSHSADYVFLAGRRVQEARMLTAPVGTVSMQG